MRLVVKRSLKDYILYSVIIASGILVDQITKILTFTFMNLHDTIPLIPSVLNLKYVQNRGAAFGMLSDQRWVFIVVSTLAIVGFSLYLYLGHAQSTLYGVSLSMVISGGIGNMIDRLALGFVVDFIQFEFVKYPVFGEGEVFWRTFPVFNGADSLVCVGAGLLILALILDIIKEVKAEKENKK